MDDLEAGRELDALVAEKVIGWTRRYFTPALDLNPQGDKFLWFTDKGEYWAYALPRYSTDIAAAWTVVERMRSLGFGVVIDNLPSTSGKSVGWTVAVVGIGISTQDTFAGTADTAPLAICRAALKAVGHD